MIMDTWPAWHWDYEDWISERYGLDPTDPNSVLPEGMILR